MRKFISAAILCLCLAGIGVDIFRALPAIWSYYDPDQQTGVSRAFIRNSNVQTIHRELLTYLETLPPGSVVLSDPQTSLEILSLTSLAAVAIPWTHSPIPLMGELRARENFVWDVLWQNLDPAECARILVDYRVDFILAASLYTGRLDGIPFISEIRTFGDFRIYACAPNLGAFAGPSRRPQRSEYEIESFDGVATADEQRADQEWVFYRRGFYSLWAAAYTKAATRTLKKKIGALSPGLYRISIRLWDYGDRNFNSLEIGLGPRKETLSWRADRLGLRRIMKDIRLVNQADEISVRILDIPLCVVIDVLGIERLSD